MKKLISFVAAAILLVSTQASAFVGTFTDMESVPAQIKDVEVHLFNLAKTQDCGDTQCYRLDVYLNGVHVARWASSPGERDGHSDFPGLYTPEWDRAKFNTKRIMGADYVSGRGDSMPYAMFIVYGKGGFAVHAGNVTGRRESHGCVRLQLENAKTLNKWMKTAMKNGGGILEISAQDTRP